MDMVTLARGATEFLLPLAALESSDVLHAMATSAMKEGLTKRVEFPEKDSPFALALFVQLAMVWVNDKAFEQVSNHTGRNEGKLIALRALTVKEIQEVLSFFDKYQVKDSFSKIVSGNAVWEFSRTIGRS